MTEAPTYTEGQPVRHKKHGRGVVRRVETNERIGALVVVVLFDRSHQFLSFVDTDQPFFNRLSELTVATR